ncbi:uncharacterized protein DNG_09782 [Cephalotrichum gorgonifer]|uniref:Uncharacterized protein n=1 Tax=Cephalotrichum gorgonifer TaxID=2041049 RepID=A0AAE8N866_9PEZI|nr:uncharacterized protein DNG_09782 [Cephalotrichum gorgonifer]
MSVPICGISPNATISPNFSLQFHDFDASRANMTNCLSDSDATYIRPSDGGSLLPWPYSLAWLLIHFPVTVLRVSHWQRVQTLSLVLAVFSIFFTAQAYTTHLAPGQVLVWTPLPIILDVGAMMQLVFLIVRENGVLLLWCALKDSFRKVKGPKKGKRGIETMRRTSQMVESATFRGDIDADAVQTVSLPPTVPDGHGLISKAYLVLFALALLTTLIILQFIGLRHASEGRHATDLKARYCSPLFQNALAVLTHCEIVPVQLGGSYTIGCIDLPGTEQRRWLTATVAVLSISLLLEALDAAIMVLVSSNTRWYGADLRRPWFSMVAGNVALVGILAVSVYYSLVVPAAADKQVWVFRYEASVDAATVCASRLTPPGIRGQILAWTDGFLGSWGAAYYGFMEGGDIRV